MASTSFYVEEPQAFSFAPNMTEASFTSPEEQPEYTETNSLLFPPAESDATDESSTSLKRSTNSKKKVSHIPRPPNAFILFRSSFIKQQHIPGSIEGNHSQLSKIVGACWQRLSYEERQVWEKKAKEARAEHKRLYPDYRFIRSKNPAPKPVPKEIAPAKFVNTMPVIGPPTSGGRLTTTTTTTQSPTKSRRRNLRSDDDPRRCEQIAKLLVAGIKGSSLEAMVKQLDAENSLRQKQEIVGSPLSQVPESAAKRSSAGVSITRRSSSCPPLDIAAAEIFRNTGAKTSAGPIRRPKPIRTAATLPYPPTFKVSRSVSPPLTPSSYLDSASTPIEGPFAHSTFNFTNATPNFIPRPESIAPKENFPFSQVSSPTNVDLTYNWSIQPLTTTENPMYFLPSSQSGVLSSSALSLPIRMHDGHAPDSGWNSEYEWQPTEDEAGTSTAPPSTPEAPSPSMGTTQNLPLEEVAAQAPFPSENPTHMPNDILDLSEYAKSLQLFSHVPEYAPSQFTIPTVSVSDFAGLNSNYNPQSDSNLWQLQNMMTGLPTDPMTGQDEYHY